MTIRRTVFAAAMATMILPGEGALAQDQESRSFSCEDSTHHLNELGERTANFGMFQLLGIYRDRWLANYVREQCEAFANGEPYTITCLNNVTDWDAIEAMVPEEYDGMSTSELAPVIAEEESKSREASEAFDYCREVGAIY